MPRAARKRRKASAPPSGAPRGRRHDRRRLWTFAALGIILLVSGLRVMHLGFPLERDEGEFGYIAQEMLRGVPMYVSAYTQKLPGTYLLYALFVSVFGQSITAIHLGLLLTNAAIMGLLFLTLRKTHNGLAGCIGALVFGVMALSPTVFGFAAHATFFVSLFAVAGLYVLLRARERRHPALFLASGVCFGLAFLMEQPAIFFAPLALVLLAADHVALEPREPARFAREAVALGAGAVAPVLLTAAYYVAIGQFPLFWFWAFQLAGAFSGQVGPAAAVQNLVIQTGAATDGFQLLWALAAVGLVVTLRDRSLGKDRYVYATFAAAAALSVVPGFYFTNHYYIAALPAVALLVGALGGGVAGEGATSGGRFAWAAGTWALIGVGLLVGLTRHAAYYFGGESDVTASRQIYTGNPFPESIAIGEYLKRHTTPQDRIAILGSETQIYFYAQRRSASRFVNTYFLTADHPRNREMQQEMIRDIERARPKYIVFVAIPTSWTFRPKSPRDILAWTDKYRAGRYDVEGVVEMTRDGSTSRWGAAARAPVTSDSYIVIMRRIDSGGAAG
ncbi:MAG TPA: glycosyltransferase family 39 protein [Candidatus Eisenbacteria bacterium]